MEAVAVVLIEPHGAKETLCYVQLFLTYPHNHVCFEYLSLIFVRMIDVYFSLVNV